MTVVKHTVFIGSTAKDLHAFRDAIKNLCSGSDFEFIGMENFFEPNTENQQLCIDKVKKCDYYIGLFGHYRGWEPEGDEKKRSITQIEFDTAKENNKTRFTAVANDDFKLAASLNRSDEEMKRQNQFLAEVRKENVIIFFDENMADKVAGEVFSKLQQFHYSKLLAEKETNSYNNNQSTEESRSKTAQILIDTFNNEKNIEGIIESLASKNKNDRAIYEKMLEDKAKSHGKQAAEYYYALGYFAYLRQDNLKSLAALKKAVKLDQTNADAWNYLGHVQNILGEIEKAKKSYKNVLKIGHTNDDQRLIAIAKGNLGLIYCDQGEYKKAEEYHLQAHKIDEEIGNKDGMATNYGNLGLIYFRQGDYTKAEVFYLKAHKINEEIGNKDGMATNYGNLGLIYFRQGDYKTSKEYYLQAYKIYEEIGYKNDIASNYDNLGNIYLIQGDLKKAEEYYLQAQKIFHELGIKNSMAKNYVLIGILENQKGNIIKACENLQKAKGLFSQIGAKHELAIIEKLMHDAGCKNN